MSGGAMESRREAGSPLALIPADSGGLSSRHRNPALRPTRFYPPIWRPIDLVDDERHRRHRHPRSRGIGHALGLAYVLVTLLFGPIRSLARRLERQEIVRRYEIRVAAFPPAAGLALSLLALGLLELSKIAVLLSYRFAGLPGAVAAMLCAKASVGYFAHVTWRAARPKVIAAYPRVARVDGWIGAQLAQLRGFRDRWLDSLRARSWYPGAVRAFLVIRNRAARAAGRTKGKLAAAFGAAAGSTRKRDR